MAASVFPKVTLRVSAELAVVLPPHAGAGSKLFQQCVEDCAVEPEDKGKPFEIKCEKYNITAVRAFAVMMCCPVDKLPAWIQMMGECISPEAMSEAVWAVEYACPPDEHANCVNPFCPKRIPIAPLMLCANALEIADAYDCTALYDALSVHIANACARTGDPMKVYGLFSKQPNRLWTNAPAKYAGDFPPVSKAEQRENMVSLARMTPAERDLHCQYGRLMRELSAISCRVRVLTETREGKDASASVLEERTRVIAEHGRILEERIRVAKEIIAQSARPTEAVPDAPVQQKRARTSHEETMEVLG
jgi:hypothetical protein